MESVPPPPNFNNSTPNGTYQVRQPTNMYTDQPPPLSHQQYERAQQSLRRVRNIRGGLFVFTAICCTKIGMDSRTLYFEEKSLLETLAQADRDCAPSASSNSQQPTSSFLTSYCFAATHFPIATVRTVVVGALHDFEQALSNSLEPNAANASFGATAVPTTTRQFPAQLFGNSILNALTRNGLTEESFQRGKPFVADSEVAFRGIDHTVLKGMLKVGQVLSFDGIGAIWDPKRIAANSRSQQGGLNEK